MIPHLDNIAAEAIKLHCMAEYVTICYPGAGTKVGVLGLLLLFFLMEPAFSGRNKLDTVLQI